MTDTTEQQSAWSTMMGRYLAVKAREDAFDAEHWRPHYDQTQTDSSHKIPDDVDQAIEALVDHRDDLCSALMAMPAPNGPALLWKLERVIQPDSEDKPCWSDWYISQTVADYRRLLGDAK